MAQVSEADIIHFVDNYVATLLWSSTDVDSDGNTVELGMYEHTDELYSESAIECRDFIEANTGALSMMMNIVPGYDWGSAGHDFALTRNRHGAGFWDRGAGDVGDRLTVMAHAAGDAYVWLNMDGKVELGL